MTVERTYLLIGGRRLPNEYGLHGIGVESGLRGAAKLES